MKYLIAAGVAIVLLAAAFAGGYYAHNSLSLFNSDTLASLHDAGREHLELIDELKAGEREAIRQLEFYRERAREYEKQIAGDADRIDRLVGGIRETQGSVERATGGIDTARSATNRIGELTDQIERVVRQLSN